MASLSSLRAVTQAAGLGGQLELPFGIDYAPKVVRDHGLQEAHTYPLVSLRRGSSFRVHARDAWTFPSLELRAANSWPALTLDCDEPSAVVDCSCTGTITAATGQHYRAPAWSLSVEPILIATRPGFSRGPSTGENQHGPHR